MLTPPDDANFRNWVSFVNVFVFPPLTVTKRHCLSKSACHCILPADNAMTSMFVVGEECFAFDEKEVGYPGVVVRTSNPSSNLPRWRYLVHYHGFEAKWDVWMTNESILKLHKENYRIDSRFRIEATHAQLFFL